MTMYYILTDQKLSDSTVLLYASNLMTFLFPRILLCAGGGGGGVPAALLFADGGAGGIARAEEAGGEAGLAADGGEFVDAE